MPVIEAGAHAEPVAGCVEGDAGHQHQVEPAAVDAAVRRRLGNAPAVDACVAIEARETHATFAEAGDDGCVDLAAAAQGAGDDRRRVQFAIHRQVGGDAAAGARQAEVRQPFVGRTGGMLAFGRAKVAAPGTHVLAQRAAWVVSAQGRRPRRRGEKGEAPPACAVADRCSRSGATGGASRSN